MFYFGLAMEANNLFYKNKKPNSTNELKYDINNLKFESDLVNDAMDKDGYAYENNEQARRHEQSHSLEIAEGKSLI